MLFLMLISTEPVPPSGAPAGGGVEAWVTTTTNDGTRVTGDQLAPEDQAITVRVRDGETRIDARATFDTGNRLIGFDVLDCADLKAAVAVAAQHPLANKFAIELRPTAAD